MNIPQKTLALGLLCVLAAAVPAMAEAEDVYLRAPHERMWKPVADDVYLQEVGRQVATNHPVESLALYSGRLLAVMDGAIHLLAGDQLEPVSGPEGRVYRLKTLDDRVWAMSDAGLFRLDGRTWRQIDTRRYVDLCMHLGQVHGATESDIYRYSSGRMVNIAPEDGYLSANLTYVMEDGSQVLPRPVTWGRIQRIASYSGTLYALRPGSLALLNGSIIDPNVADWGELPSRNTRDLMAHGSRLLVATDAGAGVLRGMAYTAITGAERLPYADTTCFAEGFADDLWIGTTTGAIRHLGGAAFQYFGPYHWLPGDNVRDIAAGGNTVYIATDAGLGIIAYEPYTMAKKAAYYERHLDEWGHKRMGFTHKLSWDGASGEWIREISDNDGGYTGHYLAAMSYKYAATGDEDARQEAVNSFAALAWLEEITPISGFPARAVWSVHGDAGEKADTGSGGLPAKWYPTSDGLWEWKGDTSSDEVNAHFYAVAVFHDLAARGPEKERAKEHLQRIMDHIVSNGWLLRDMDGEPTRWGRWDPEYLQRPYGMYARGLNGLEAQMYAKVAHALTGEQRFADAYQQLLDWRYHEHTVRTKLTFPPSYVVPWDDRLAFLSYYPLLKYTTDDAMRSVYLRSVERSWEVKRMEQVPWYNFVYGIITGNDCEVDKAIAHLREWPLDLTNHSYQNSHRSDLAPEPGYVPYGGGTRAMSPRETEAKRSSRSALPYDGGSGGRAVTEPTGWLEDYWMGRYYGFIEPPTVTDPELLTVEPRTGQQFGAKPYDGPPRPEGIIPGAGG